MLTAEPSTYDMFCKRELLFQNVGALSDIHERITLSVKKVLKSIRLKFLNEKGFFLKKIHLQLIRSNHPTNCHTLDLVKIPNLTLDELSHIQFSFRNKPSQVEVRIEDRLHRLTRAFKYNKFSLGLLT